MIVWWICGLPFGVFDFPFCACFLMLHVHVSRCVCVFIRHLSSYRSIQSPANPNDFINSNLLRPVGVVNQHVQTKRRLKYALYWMHSNYFHTLLFENLVLVFVTVDFRLFCIVKQLTCQYLSDCSSFIFFIVLFFVYRFATDSVCTMRFRFQMVSVYATVIGYDF